MPKYKFFVFFQFGTITILYRKWQQKRLYISFLRTPKTTEKGRSFPGSACSRIASSDNCRWFFSSDILTVSFKNGMHGEVAKLWIDNCFFLVNPFLQFWPNFRPNFTGLWLILMQWIGSLHYISPHRICYYRTSPCCNKN